MEESTPNEVNPIAFGRVLGRLDAQAEDIGELKQGQKETLIKLDRLLEYQAKQRGSAKTLAMFGSAVAAAIGWAISWATK